MTKEENIKAIIENISEDVFYREFLTYAEQNEWEKYLTNIINCIIEKENKQLKEKQELHLNRIDELMNKVVDLKSVIDEVREYIFNIPITSVISNTADDKDTTYYDIKLLQNKEENELLEILDKVKGSDE